MSKKNGIILAVIGGIVIELGTYSIFQIMRAMHRIKLNNAKKLEEYRSVLKKTVELLLDDTLKEIDKKRLEKLKKKIETKIQNIEKSVEQ